MTKSEKSGASNSAQVSRSGSAEVNFSEDPLSEKIGKSLRSMYDEVAQEPVPDAFLALLAKADETQKS